MRKLLRAMIHRREILFFTMALIFALGIYSYQQMPKQETPTISAPVAIMTVTYPGASPEDIETKVTDKIEDELSEIEGIEYVQSTSMDSASLIVVFLDIRTDQEEAFQILREKMKDVESVLPAGCSKVDVNTDWNDTAGFMLAIAGDGYTPEMIAPYADALKSRLDRIDGVSKVNVYGDEEQRVAIEVDFMALNQYALTFEDIAKLIQAHNLSIPTGKIDGAGGKINVKAEGEFAEISDIENLIVAGDGQGSVVRLKDIAEIKMEDDPDGVKYLSDGQTAVLVTGYFDASINVIKTGEDVAEALEAFKATLTSDLQLNTLLFQPDSVKEKVDNLMVSLFQGMAFVIIVVFLGMGLRNAAVVSIAIPMSVVATFSVMRLLDYEIHMISIAALIIALGMLVDNAIVVSDAIQVRLDKGEERMHACIEGVLEVAVPVFTSTLTTIAVFLPLMLLDTIAGEFIISIPVVVITSLLMSYIIALFVTPVLAYLFYRKRENPEKAFFLKQLYVGLLHFSMHRRGLSALLLIIAILCTGWIYQDLGLQFFPKAEIDVLYVDIHGDNEADLSATLELEMQAEAILKSFPEVSGVSAVIGDGFPKFYYTMAAASPQKNFAQIYVALELPKGSRNLKPKLVQAIQAQFNEKLVGGKATIKELEQGEPLGAPVRLRLSGDDIKAIKGSEQTVIHLLSGIPGAINVHSDFSDFTFEYHIDVDDDKLNFLGFNHYDIQNEISYAVAGRQVSTFNQDGEVYPIVLKSTIGTIGELENLSVRSAMGTKVPLKALADIALKEKLPMIRHYNGDRSINVYADVLLGYSSISIQEALEQKLQTVELAGTTYDFEGEKENINEEFAGIGISAVFALFLIYMILLIQFGSFVQPLIIFSTIPMSAMGSIAGLWLFKQPLSFTALFGMVSLFGIVVNNAIILIDYMNIKLRSGMEIHEVCDTAIRYRFRPIMLTTTTTIIGLIPLVTSGSPLFEPMSIALMFGLSVSTLLTMIVVPVFYLVLHKAMVRLELRQESQRHEQY